MAKENPKEVDERETTWALPAVNADVDEQTRRALQLRDDLKSQCVRFAVVRGAVVHRYDGRDIREFEEVTLSDFRDPELLMLAVKKGCVSEVRESDLRHRLPKTAERNRYRTTRALIGVNGIIGPNSWVVPSDFPFEPPRLAQSAKDVRLDALTGRVLAPFEAQAAHPGVTLDQVWQRLLAKGFVIDTHAKNTAKSA